MDSEERGLFEGLQLFRPLRVLGVSARNCALSMLEELVEQTWRDRRGGESMSINDLPAIMGTVLIVAGLALVGVSAWPRAEGKEKTTQAGALIIVVGALLLGLSIFVSYGK
jgi:hypothetical protein